MTGSTRVSHDDRSFASAAHALAGVLRGPVRAAILDEALRDGDLRAALARLRGGMRAHAFRTAAGPVELDVLVPRLDALTRAEGIHVFLEWHEVAYRFIEEDIPVLLLDYVTAMGGARTPRQTLAILLDYYFLYVLALCATRVWDGGDPGENLELVTGLLRDLQGADGSGLHLVEDAETLLFVATSTFEPDDLAYHRLLAKVASLPEERRLRVALAAGPVLGCHLRWGFPALYECDLPRMRADNFIDYPWLFFAVATLMQGWVRKLGDGEDGIGRARAAAALLNALSPDPDAFLGEPPASLAAHHAEHDRLRALFARHRVALAGDFAALRPVAGRYSPLGFHFNFPHNAVFAMVLIALLAEPAPNVPLDALLRDGPDDGVGELARRLTEYAVANPEPRGSRSVPGLHYDLAAARRSYADALAALDRLGAAVGPPG